MSENNDNNNQQEHQLKRLFDKCFQLSLTQQQEIIDNSTCSKEIKQKVKKLLKINIDDVEITGSIIDSVQLSLDIKSITIGMKIDAYVLLSPLGHGGQGEVWLAQRDTGDFNHQVAIKFLKPVHNEKELQRFENERELLAQLKHSNIAQLLGGGQLSDKRPYMILELVEGLPLMEYCRQKQYGLKDYLSCFLQICEAISYAHSHLVIHRDIKPENIIITDQGVVKLLDFGIAKTITEEQVNTQTIPIMTLAYSSPEQVTGAAISTATDIYTLGLLFYEMLTGQRAQAVNTDIPFELIHEITAKTPIFPSQVEVLISLHRNYSSKQLKGDLDNLIMMAVRKEPNRRYPTVAAMAQDVKNYLDGKPLLATGESHWYKSRKLISRNPIISALSLLTLSFMIALPMILYNNQIQLERQRDLEIIARQQAQQQTQIANQQKTLAQRTTDFLYNILESASPLASQGKSLSLDDVLISAKRQLTHGLENEPELKSNLLDKLAGIQQSLGNNSKAIDFYHAALELYEKNGDIKQQLKILGQLAITYFFKGNTQESKNYQEKAMLLSQQVTDPLTLGWHQARMATLLFYENKKAEIRKLSEKALLNLTKNNIQDAELLGRLNNGLALAFTNYDNNKSLEYISKALEYAEALHGKMHPKYQNRLLNKAIILIRLKRYEQAESLLLKARHDAKLLFTIQHPHYSKVIAELAVLYHDTGRFKEAEVIYQQSKEISEKTNGKNSIPYVLQTNNLGYLYEDMGQYKLAEKYYRESLKIRQQVYANDEYRVASSMSNLARLLTKMGQLKEAQTLLNQVIPIFILNNKSNLSNNIVQLAITLADKKNCSTANVTINQIFEKVKQLSNKSWRRMYYELWLGQLAYKCQQHDLAKTLLSSTQQKSQSIYAKDSDGQKRIFNITQKILKKMTL